MPEPDPQYIAARNAALAAAAGSPAQLAAVETAHTRYLALNRGGTTRYRIPFPSPLDPAFELADAIRRLAEAVGPGSDDTTLPVISGVPSGWTVTAAMCTRRLGVCQLNLTITPSTAQNQTGNIPSLTLCTVQSGFRPRGATYVTTPDVLASITLSAGGTVSMSARANPWPAAAGIGVAFIYLLAP